MIDIFLDIESRLPVALLALVVTGLVGVMTGPLGGCAQPVLWRVVDGLAGGLGSRLDRRERTGTDLMFRGFLLTVPVVLAAGAAGFIGERLAAGLPVRGVADALLLAAALAGGAVWRTMISLFNAMNKQGKGGYYMVVQSTRLDLSAADDFAITRAGMGMAARAFDKGMVAPVVWYLLAGLTGAYVYAALAALVWRFGRDGFSKGFARVPALFEYLMGAAPNLVAGVLVALAGLFTPTGGMTRAFIGIGFRGRAPYAEGGLPLAAIAYALNVVLGGPGQDLDGRSLPRAWTGPDGASARLEPGHLRRAVYISLMAWMIWLAVLAGFMALNA